MKKIIGAAFAAVMLVSVFSLGACKKAANGGITLADFAADTDSAEVGTIYSVQKSVLDTDGNEYRLSVRVKDSKGASPDVIFGEFSVEDLGGYTITYSVVVASGDTRERTVSLSVSDTEGPYMFVPVFSVGTQGVEYVLPVSDIKISDNSKETIAPVIRLYRAAGETDTEIAYDGSGKFTPADYGIFKATVSAADSRGNKSEVIRKI
jgi:hypothetical protein